MSIGNPADTWTLRDFRTLLYQPESERTRTSLSELISFGAPWTQNHSSSSILMVSWPVMCLVQGNTLVNLVNPQVTTRVKS